MLLAEHKQVHDPVNHSLGLSALFAALPLMVLFVLLGALSVSGRDRRGVPDQRHAAVSDVPPGSPSVGHELGQAEHGLTRPSRP